MGSNTEATAAGCDFKGHLALGSPQGTDWEFVSPWLSPSLTDGSGHYL